MPRPQPNSRHPDLFPLDDPPVPLAATERTKLLPSVSALLTETTLASRAAREARDEDRT
jgi:hypothetical protein